MHDAPGELHEMPIEYMTYPLTARTHRYGFPAGGLFSTARDYARLGCLVANLGTLDRHRYLTEASVLVQSAGAGGAPLDRAFKACRQAAVERFGA